MTKEKGVKYGIASDSESCKIVKGEETLPSAIKPPVIREELPTIPSGYDILQEHLMEMNAVLERVFEELRLIRTGELPTPGGVPGEGMYYVTDEVAMQVATPNPPAGQVIDSDRISFDTLTGVFGPAPDGYQRERVHDVTKRNAPKATVINDGTVTIFVITSPNGRKWSPPTPILPGEARTFFNVWELRLRCAVAGNLTTFSGGVYRVTEYDFWLSYVRIISIGPPNVTLNFSPTPLSTLQNVAQPAALVPILATALVPVNTPTLFRVMVAMSNIGNLNAIITNGGNTQTVLLNAAGGPALAATGLYTFDILINAGDSVNFSYTNTGGFIQILRVQEIDAATT